MQNTFDIFFSTKGGINHHFKVTPDYKDESIIVFNCQEVHQKHQKHQDFELTYSRKLKESMIDHRDELWDIKHIADIAISEKKGVFWQE
jgi:hypothetical protein